MVRIDGGGSSTAELDIVLFGAIGFVGRLVAGQLAGSWWSTSEADEVAAPPQ